jgi:hypothetical protein
MNVWLEGSNLMFIVVVVLAIVVMFMFGMSRMLIPVDMAVFSYFRVRSVIRDVRRV